MCYVHSYTLYALLSFSIILYTLQAIMTWKNITEYTNIVSAQGEREKEKERDFALALFMIEEDKLFPKYVLDFCGNCRMQRHAAL